MSAPSCSGRTCQAAHSQARASRPFQRGPARQRPATARRICSSLEDDFKKHVLGMSNGASSSSQDRLKDLSASASSRLGGAAGDLSGAAAADGAPGAAAGQQGALQPPAPDSNQYTDESPAAGAAPYAPHLPFGSDAYHPLEFYPTSHVDLDWGSSDATGEPWPGSAAVDRARCFVILFGVGRAETEGIYSLRAVAKDDGLPVDTIVAFENEDDALRYSTLLEATMDHEPTVWPIEWGELLEFCNSAGYRCRLEPSGSLLIPPDYNVDMTDWEKSLKMRRGEFGVLGAEPADLAGELELAPHGGLGSLFLDSPSWLFELEGARDEAELEVAQLCAAIDSQLSSPEALEAVRFKLECLLPRDE